MSRIVPINNAQTTEGNNHFEIIPDTLPNTAATTLKHFLLQ